MTIAKKEAMTTRERMRRVFEHREADRVPMHDRPWPATLERWRAEGLPENTDWCGYFGLDLIARIWPDNSPRYPERVIEETSDHVIRTTAWGATLKEFKHIESTPEFLDFTIRDPESWAAAKARMAPDRARIDWAELGSGYPRWEAEGRWIEAILWFGFDVTHSWMAGTETVLMALVEEPEWLADMFSHQLETQLALLEMVWDAGHRFQSVFWPDDIAYTGKQFFSLDTYRKILKPFQKRAADWAHDRGVFVHLHTDGDVTPFIPDFIEIGVDALNPLEVKAGMDPLALKKQYGDKLVLHGGLDAMLYNDMDRLMAELERLLPAMKEGGGYIFATDHSIPASVSLADFARVVARFKQLGKG
jgi:uroporphyrinogen decarboxylase